MIATTAALGNMEFWEWVGGAVYDIGSFRGGAIEH